ncbi:hypothetical protein PAMP_009922 [Pampus punctatissimus]
MFSAPAVRNKIVLNENVSYLDIQFSQQLVTWVSAGLLPCRSPTGSYRVPVIAAGHRLRRRGGERGGRGEEVEFKPPAHHCNV